MNTSFATRADRAAQLAASGGIVRSGNEFLVPSLNSDLVYRVRLDGERLVCNCEDYKRRQAPCKHVLASAIVAQQQEQR